MNEEDKYDHELAMLTEQRKAENEKAWNELALEKQRTKTEKAKRGTGKIFARLISTIVIIAVLCFVATWILSLFYPQSVTQAISVFKR